MFQDHQVLSLLRSSELHQLLCQLVIWLHCHWWFRHPTNQHPQNPSIPRAGTLTSLMWHRKQNALFLPLQHLAVQAWHCSLFPCHAEWMQGLAFAFGAVYSTLWLLSPSEDWGFCAFSCNLFLAPQALTWLFYYVRITDRLYGLLQSRPNSIVSFQENILDNFVPGEFLFPFPPSS